MKKIHLYFALIYVLADIVGIYLGLYFAYLLRADGGVLYFWPLNQYLRLVILVIPIWIVFLAYQGLYNPRNLPRGWNALARLLIAQMSSWGVILILLYLWRSQAALVLSRLVIIYGISLTVIFTVSAHILIDLIRSLFYRTGAGLIRTVVIAHQGAQEFINQLKLQNRHARHIIGVINNNFLINLKKISRDEKNIEEVIVADPNISEKTLLEIIDWVETHGANFVLVPSLFSIRSSNVETGTLAGRTIMYFKRTPLEGWGRIFKRLLDIIIVVPSIIIASPIFLILAIIVPFSTGGGTIYRQKRIGQDGKELYVHKFMSMYVDQSRHQGLDWSTDEENDPRITPLGRIIRRTNLDELPQLFDVLIGTMSFVGPRPEQPKYVEKFSHEIPDYLKRHYVKTGLTGWAQINGLRGDTSISERVKYDIYYIDNWSIWFDLRIIMATAIMMFRSLFS